MAKQTINVYLLGLEFNIKNKGCEALGYSFAYILQQVADTIPVSINYYAYVYENSSEPNIPNSEKKINLIKYNYKSMAFWSTLRKNFKSADLIVDFTGGDSFSDIYGLKRYFIGSFIKLLAIHSKTPFLLGPQTYGPFKNVYAKLLAKKILKKSDYVYARDALSTEYVESLCSRKIITSTDVAFSLPYSKMESPTDKIKVGFNPSGLLWNGGYTSNNQFGLSVNYQDYCKELLSYLDKAGKYVVYLIPHVGDTPSSLKHVENDANACEDLHNLFPSSTIPVYDALTPMDAKKYISGMDVFIGARMHATVAAFSSGVATIPFSYSRKFEGLYSNVSYKCCINARELSTQEAIEKTIEYINNYQQLKKEVLSSQEVVHKYQDDFKSDMTNLLRSIINKSK